MILSMDAQLRTFGVNEHTKISWRIEIVNTENQGLS